MVDIWFTFIVAMPFLEVILHTIKDQLRSKSEDLSDNIVPLNDKFIYDDILVKLKIIEIIGKYCLPIIFVVLSTIFFSIGMCLKYKII